MSVLVGSKHPPVGDPTGRNDRAPQRDDETRRRNMIGHVPMTRRVPQPSTPPRILYDGSQSAARAPIEVEWVALGLEGGGGAGLGAFGVSNWFFMVAQDRQSVFPAKLDRGKVMADVKTLARDQGTGTEVRAVAVMFVARTTCLHVTFLTPRGEIHPV